MLEQVSRQTSVERCVLDHDLNGIIRKAGGLARPGLCDELVVATSDGGSKAAFNDSRAITDEGEVGRGHDTWDDEGGGNSSSWDAVTIQASGLPLWPRTFFSAE